MVLLGYWVLEQGATDITPSKGQKDLGDSSTTSTLKTPGFTPTYTQTPASAPTTIAPTHTQTSTSAPVTAALTGKIVVTKIIGYRFSEPTKQIDAGDELMWNNYDDNFYTLVEMDNKIPNITVKELGRKSVLFNTTGTYRFGLSYYKVQDALKIQTINVVLNASSPLTTPASTALFIADNKTLTIGETWNVGSGWTLTALSIDAKATPRQVWLTLSRNGIKLDDKILAEDSIYNYNNMFSVKIASVYPGRTTDIVLLTNPSIT